MFIAHNDRLSTIADKIAWARLVRLGVIEEVKALPAPPPPPAPAPVVIYREAVPAPKRTPKPKKPRKVVWKKLEATGKGGCVQCGGDSDDSKHDHRRTPYGMCLCLRCTNIHFNSIAKGLRPSDEVTWNFEEAS